MSGWPDELRLDQCPPGLFEHRGQLGFRSEYSTTLPDGFAQPDAYVVATGEYFWGGAGSSAERSALMVRPIGGDLAAQRAAAWCAGRDAAAGEAHCRPSCDACVREKRGCREANRIAALTPPADIADALAQAVEWAVLAERERCAGIVERVAIAGTVHLAAVIRQRGAGGSDGG